MIAIVQVEHLTMTVLVIALVSLAIPQAETITLLLDGLYFYDGAIGGIIFRSRFGDNLHVSDVGSAQSVKFHRTGHLLVVNIDERRTLIQAF